MVSTVKQGAALRRGALAAILLALPLAACSFDDILEVRDPDIINPGDLNSVQGAAALYTGALGDFALAKDGGIGDLGIVEAGGFFSDEFRFGGTPPEVRAMDLRDVREETTAWYDTYRNLHRARESAEKAARVLTEVGSNPQADARIGEMWAVSGLIHILFGEHYCSGIPFSTTEPEITYGDPLTTVQVFERALERLGTAEQYADGDARIANLVRVARGRALLNLGRPAEAAAAVAQVPTEFAYYTYHSNASNRQVNFLYVDNFEADRYSVSDNEGQNGLNFASADDPRVPVQRAGLSRFDNRTPMVRYLKIASRAAPVLTADGVEARLIEAEAHLAAGRIDAWLNTLNALRAAEGMAPLSDPGTPAARVDLLFRERAFSLFNTGHRLGDLRRLVRQYGRDWQTVYPVGEYHKDNLTRGNQLSIIIPQIERNNPKFTGCDPTVP